MRMRSNGRVDTQAVPHRNATVVNSSTNIPDVIDNTADTIPKMAATGMDGTSDASMSGVVSAQWYCRSHPIRVEGDSHT